MSDNNKFKRYTNMYLILDIILSSVFCINIIINNDGNIYTILARILGAILFVSVLLASILIYAYNSNVKKMLFLVGSLYLLILFAVALIIKNDETPTDLVYISMLIILMLIILMILVCLGSLIIVYNNYVLLIVLLILAWVIMLVLGSIFFIWIFNYNFSANDIWKTLCYIMNYSLTQCEIDKMSSTSIQKLFLFIYGKIIDMAIFAGIIGAVISSIKAIRTEIIEDSRKKDDSDDNFVMIRKDMLNIIQKQNEDMKELLEKQNLQLNTLIMVTEEIKEN